MDCILDKKVDTDRRLSDDGIRGLKREVSLHWQLSNGTEKSACAREESRSVAIFIVNRRDGYVGAYLLSFGRFYTFEIFKSKKYMKN